MAAITLVASVALPAGASAQAPPPAAPEPPAAGTMSVAFQPPVECFIEKQFPQLDSNVAPGDMVARARVYFKSAKSPDFYYVEMKPPVPGVPTKYQARLPKPRKEASPITYYATVVGKDMTETRTAEVKAIVVEKKEDCGDKPVAAIALSGPAAIFSAGGLAVVPAGFAAAGTAIGAATIGIGAAAVGATAATVAVVTKGNKPAPPASGSR